MPACFRLQRMEALTCSWQESTVKANGRGRLSDTGTRATNGDRAEANTATSSSISPIGWLFPRFQSSPECVSGRLQAPNDCNISVGSIGRSDAIRAAVVLRYLEACHVAI